MKGIQRYAQRSSNFVMKPYKYVREKFREMWKKYTAPGTKLHPLALYMGNKYRDMKVNYGVDKDLEWITDGFKSLPETMNFFKV
mmetsp:Transcript_1100/g.979  ORF Transcript_1100/g.979 Transcript_1100/m.979 type:complete len:84 (-) Transcript_1100:438-689(-)